jgi:transcriptional regulator with XRE-family HTH domain
VERKLSIRIRCKFSEIENGDKLPSLTVIYKITQSFGLTLTEFVRRIEERLKMNDEVNGKEKL